MDYSFVLLKFCRAEFLSCTGDVLSPIHLTSVHHVISLFLVDSRKGIELGVR